MSTRSGINRMCMRSVNMLAVCAMVSAQAISVRAADDHRSGLRPRTSKSDINCSTAVIRAAAQKGLAWLLDHPKELRRTQVPVYALQEINRKYCHDRKLARYIRKNIPKISRNDDASKKLVQRLLDGSTAYAYSAECAEILLGKLPAGRSDNDMAIIIDRALYCDIHPLSGTGPR